jgi:large subunit ribosomal protein L3
MKMAGEYGNKKVTIENLEVVKVDKENNQIMLKGSVPGANSGIVYIVK